MSVREELFHEVEVLCQDSAFDSIKLSQELSEFIGGDEVLEYYILHGPFSIFPETMFEVVMLSKKCLYDFEIKQEGTLQHLLPLSQIIEISEEFRKVGDVHYLLVHFKASALGTGLAFESNLQDTSNIRKLYAAVARKIVEST